MLGYAQSSDQRYDRVFEGGRALYTPYIQKRVFNLILHSLLIFILPTEKFLINKLF